MTGDRPWLRISAGSAPTKTAASRRVSFEYPFELGRRSFRGAHVCGAKFAAKQAGAVGHRNWPVALTTEPAHCANGGKLKWLGAVGSPVWK